MTVIAWDGKTLAADKRACRPGAHFTVTKLFRSGDRIVGFAGDAGRLGQFKAWFDAGADPEKYPKNEGGQASYFFAVRSDGRIEKYEETGYPIIVEDKFFATGSGGDYATAAMHLGLDARQAVEVAIACDETCGGGVDTLTLDTPQQLDGEGE